MPRRHLSSPRGLTLAQPLSPSCHHNASHRISPAPSPDRASPRPRLARGIATFVALAALSTTVTAHAATITVNTVTDDLTTNGNCSLREAIRAANTDSAVDACTAGSGTDRIVLSGGTYRLNRVGTDENAASTGDLDVLANLTIAGAGSTATVIDASDLDRAFHIIASNDGSNVVEVAFSDLTILNGNAGVGRGGAIYAQGLDAETTLTNVNIDNNTAGLGGGIFAEGPFTATTSNIINNTAGGLGGGLHLLSSVTLTDCNIRNNSGTGGGGAYISTGFSAGSISGSLFAFNTAESLGGGGILNAGTLNLSLLNSTFSGNRASGTGRGGGIQVGDGTNGGIAFISQCTITANTSARGGGIARVTGGATFPTTIEIGNSIVARNTATNDPDVSGTVTSRNNNLIGDRTGATGFTGSADQSGTTASPLNPLIGTLRNNGGNTDTHATDPTSTAIDRGTCQTTSGAPVATDQRGVRRPFGTTCDIGAFEYRPFATVIRVTSLDLDDEDCPTGGTRIDSGADFNGDQALQDTEIETSDFVCNGNNGATSLIRQAPINVGNSNCPFGGVFVESGIDNGDGGGIANNGNLESGEVDAQRRLCNGADGFTTLQSVTNIATGDATCPFGGKRFDSGIDNGDGGGTARNATLEDGEIDTSAVVCNGIDGFTTLARTTTIALNSPECSGGGTKYEIGLDNGDGGGTARNGTLENGEVDASSTTCNGTGFSTLTRLTTLTSGSGACPEGGQRIDNGLDNGDGGGIARNGILENGEVDNTANICNGLNGGINGFSSLARFTAVSPGATCTNGGQRLDTGLDNGDGGGTANNGTLENGEVDATTTLCQGSAGFNTLQRVTALPVGNASCPNGGQQIQSGLDDGLPTGTARNNTLEAGEVESTANLCNGTSGANSLNRIVTLTPGSPSCAKGGFRYDAGLDNGRNGGIANNAQLESGEVTSTTTICAPDDGTSGLVIATRLNVGDTNCPFGGQKLETGFDNGDGGGTAKNGKLEAGEIDSSAFVCDGRVAFNSVTRITQIPVGGTGCTAGGQKIEIGLDDGLPSGTPNNGTLEDGEVDNTAIVCNGESDPGSVRALLTQTTLGPDSTQCPVTGGVLVQSGLDNGDGVETGSIRNDGVLQQGEVDVETVVCEGSGFVATVTSLELGDKDCPRGGLRLDTGLDDGAGGGTAGDGILQPGETDATSIACNGDDAFSSLISVTTVDKGDENCPAGGQKFESGFDDGSGEDSIAKNGILEPGEVKTTNYACNATPQLNRTTSLDVGDDTCPNGGQRLESGLDDNGNGTLDDDEVDGSAAICNGPTGVSTLIKTTELEPGNKSCPAGGVRLDFGLDNGDEGGTANNAELEPGEIDSTSFVCDGNAGDVLVNPVEIPNGANGCTFGGVALEIGNDDNGDGVLDKKEIDRTASTCFETITKGASGGCNATSTGDSRKIAWATLLTLLVIAATRRRSRRSL